jgi:hypothetical protein
MEVLAAIFVLSFGLLGVLSVVPYGMYQVERAGIANHGGNCLRGIENEISIRKWNTPELFNVLNPNSMSSGTVFFSGTDAVVDCTVPIIVDPLFEVRLDTGTPSPFGNFAHHATFVPNGTPTLPQLKERYQNIFLWQEDVDFTKIPDGGNNFFTTESTDGTITPPSAGKYSWFFVVNISPAQDPIPETPPVPVNHILASTIGTDAEVRVAVCYNRSPGDVLCEGNFGNAGGTPITLKTPTSTGGMITLEDLPDEFDTSDTRYMLLMARSTTTADARCLPHWYQIIYRNENQFMLTGEKSLGDLDIERAILIRGIIYVSKSSTVPWSAD